MVERQEALKADLRKIMEKRVRYAVDYKKHVMRAADLLEGSIKINLQSLQAENDKREMDLMVQERDEEIEAKRAELVQSKPHRFRCVSLRTLTLPVSSRDQD